MKWTQRDGPRGQPTEVVAASGLVVGGGSAEWGDGPIIYLLGFYVTQFQHQAVSWLVSFISPHLRLPGPCN